MPRRIAVPNALKFGPFTARDALQAGVARWHLETASYRRVLWDAYVWAGLPDTPLLRLQAAALHLPPEAVFAGLAAAWLHDLDVVLSDPIEVIIPPTLGIKTRPGVRVSRAEIEPREGIVRHALRTTAITRTIFHLGRRSPLVEAVVVADMALHKRLLTLNELVAAVEAQPGTRNVRRLRRLVQEAEPRSESAMESRLRILLVDAGLPRPQAQVDLRDANGAVLGRADLYYPSHRLAIEYDGGTHRDSLVRDNRRQNRILAAGYSIRRFTAPDVFGHPDVVAAQIRGELAQPPRALQHE